MNGQELVQTNTKRCLGIIIDQQLSFTKNVEHICNTTLSFLNKISHIFSQSTIEMSLKPV